MANNPYANKVEFAGQTIMDLTGDTVTPSDVLSGVTFHDRSGASQTGSMSIIEHGSNSNGEYWKFSDGLLICAKSVKSTVSFSAWGSLYESSPINLGNWPCAFLSGTIPYTAITFKNSQAASFSTGVANVTNTSAGSSRGIRPNNPGSVYIIVDVIGIGMWK